MDFTCTHKATLPDPTGNQSVTVQILRDASGGALLVMKTTGAGCCPLSSVAVARLSLNDGLAVCDGILDALEPTEAGTR